MGFGCSNWVLGAIAGTWLSCMPALASAEDLCGPPSEATDPQPLHINGAKTFVYKTIGDTELRLYVFNSADHKASYKAPAAVFFYGGGFLFGDIRRYQTQATHLALRGLVTVLVDYRAKCRHGSTMLDSVSDGKSAMRWVRAHADEFGIDLWIAAVGSSSGGMMAAATALDTELDDPNDDKKIDPRPNALILYNPALTNTPKVVELTTKNFRAAVADQVHDIFPSDHLDRGLPPTILFAGTATRVSHPQRRITSASAPERSKLSARWCFIPVRRMASPRSGWVLTIPRNFRRPNIGPRIRAAAATPS